MKYKFKHLIKDTKGVLLSCDEKDNIKASLMEHIESHPLVEGSGSFCMPKRVSFSEWTGDYFHNKKVMVPSALLLLIVLTGGVSFASSHSLPGHFLYPVKILNEKLSSALTFDPEEKTKVLALNALNRLEEAEILFIDGKLDEKTEVAITRSFEKDSDLADKSLSALQRNSKETGAEAALKFKGDLDKHQKILTSFSASGNVDTKNKILITEVDKVIAKLGSSSKDTLNKNEKKKNAPKRERTSVKINTITNTSGIVVPLNSSATTSAEAKVEAEVKETNENENGSTSTGSVKENDNKDDSTGPIKIPDIKVNTNVNGSGSGSVSVPSIGL